MTGLPLVTVLLQLYLTIVYSHTSHKFVSTSLPPLLDAITYSLATSSSNGRTAMNILTYAIPVSAKPQRMWCVSLFKGTQSHENFLRDKKGVLQVLAPCHWNIIKLLGGSSSRDVNKEDGCVALGHKWIVHENGLKLLPNCLGYLQLAQVGQTIDCGAHDLVVCSVEDMFFEETSSTSRAWTSDEFPKLTTASLRRLGVINELGRVV